MLGILPLLRGFNEHEPSTPSSNNHDFQNSHSVIRDFIQCTKSVLGLQNANVMSSRVKISYKIYSLWREKNGLTVKCACILQYVYDLCSNLELGHQSQHYNSFAVASFPVQPAWTVKLAIQIKLSLFLGSMMKLGELSSASALIYVPNSKSLAWPLGLFQSWNVQTNLKIPSGCSSATSLYHLPCLFHLIQFDFRIPITSVSETLIRKFNHAAEAGSASEQRQKHSMPPAMVTEWFGCLTHQSIAKISWKWDQYKCWQQNLSTSPWQP
jgi:hypothetical protein